MAIETNTPRGFAHPVPAAPRVVPGGVPQVGNGNPALEMRPRKDHDHSLFGADGLTFWDVLDMINPLQHVPVVSTIYRAITEDELSPGAGLIGGGLFGGFIGLGIAMINAMVEDMTGRDLGGHVYAMMTDDDIDSPQTPEPDVLVATAPPSDPAPWPRPRVNIDVTALPPVPIHHGAAAFPATVLPVSYPRRERAQQAAPEPHHPAFLMNTNLIKHLIDLRLEGVSSERPTKKNGGAGEPPSRAISDPGPRYDFGPGAQAAGHRAYHRGLATRTAAAGSVFTPLATPEPL